MLFKNLKIKDDTMGRVFESLIPEKNYVDKVSDLECRLNETESLLKKALNEHQKGIKTNWYKRTLKYFSNKV
jgi:hypothetical protein